MRHPPSRTGSGGPERETGVATAATGAAAAAGGTAGRQAPQLRMQTHRITGMTAIPHTQMFTFPSDLGVAGSLRTGGGGETSSLSVRTQPATATATATVTIAKTYFNRIMEKLLFICPRVTKQRRFSSTLKQRPRTLPTPPHPSHAPKRSSGARLYQENHKHPPSPAPPRLQHASSTR